LVIADTFLKRYIYEKTMGEQHATILKLYESEKKYNEKIEVYQKVLEQSPVSVVITDTEGKIEYVNPYFSELTGYQLEEVLGKNPRILKSGKTDSAKYMELWKKLKNGEEWRGEFVNLNKENQEYEESAIITPIKNADNHVTHYVSIGENITQRKQKEQELQNALIRAEEAAVAKSLFLANMSHEIRTPMNAVIGMAYLALQTDLSKKQADYISKIHKAATSLLGILNDILDFSKIEAEKLELECEEFNLDSTVLETIGLTTQAGYEKGLEFIYHLSPEIPKQLLGDSLRLRQVIANLVSNAVKFTQKGKITIDIKMIGNTVKNTGEKIQLIFSVVDTGIGIAEADLKKLFEAFSQTDNSMTKRFGGTGLGLAICKKLVSLMEGEIWVESIPKKGRIFSFSASFKIADTCKEECCVFPSEIHNKRILIVGDSNEERYILAEYLKAMDFQTEEASSAREAENFIKEADQTQFYDIVLVDWKMERMNGLELIRKINRELGLFHVPKVILLTSCNREDIREQAGDISIHNILVKPIGQSMLYNAIVNIYLAEKKNTDTKVRVDTDICCLDKISVLLVEDNEVNRQIASELLESQGMIVEIAQNGLEAVHKVENMPAEAPYHLILMDLQMPKMDGFEATRQIRKKNIQIPIIAMTARTLLEEQKECYKAGMNDHISKPIDIDLLFQTIER
ncbi:MAG TPA: response regulator, partial [Lachnospiraceae bacterium]|nr:response regulator [Lachnospiraceae bacterium]